ncbi:triose-phosphate isomerase [Vicingaceae bacterium]|nr:triose-phosphate isomerase [Vicingaceae bacterium]
MRKKIVAGNWKMNNNFQEGIDLTNELIENFKPTDLNKQLVVCPPFIHLNAIAELFTESEIRLGGQNCHTSEKGAYTGEVSAEMLKSLGVRYCLVGHSERRAYFFEDDQELFQKIKQLLAKDIQPIFCCGEMLEDRKEGGHFDVIEDQLELLWKLSKTDFQKVIIAYEPVWAIGTGQTATAEQAQEIHKFIRSRIAKKMDEAIADNASILYGGSCKPTNAAELFSKPDVDGGLIGGAALEANDFLGIYNAL